MASMDEHYKPHILFIPLPFVSHIKALLQFSKLLHHKGFHVTFVNTEFNHKRLMRSDDVESLNGLPDFRFETIPDGLDPNVAGPERDMAILYLIRANFPGPVRELIARLSNPPVTSIISDAVMSFTVGLAKELGIPSVIVLTISACAFMGITQYRTLVQKGILPLKDESYLSNGYLDKIIDWIPSMITMRLRDLPINLLTTNPNDIIPDISIEAAEKACDASAVVIHTFNALEQNVLDAISSIIPRVYAIGPLQLLLDQLPEDPLKSIQYCPWNEEVECFQWLNSKANKSVLYVSFGSLITVTPQQLIEFAWGLANSEHPFLWIIRPELVTGESAILPSEFLDETKERSLIATWCSQEQVLHHPSVGGFLTHSGWNSTIESVTAGVPMLCRPFLGDQLTNCKYCCDEWGIGMKIKSDVKRDDVEKLVRELMEGKKGEEIRKKVMELKKLAEEAATSHGTSSINLDKLITDVLLK